VGISRAYSHADARGVQKSEPPARSDQERDKCRYALLGGLSVIQRDLVICAAEIDGGGGRPRGGPVRVRWPVMGLPDIALLPVSIPMQVAKEAIDTVAEGL
jgi:hypothetical protein